MRPASRRDHRAEVHATAPRSLAVDLLPLAILATMLAIALGLEAALPGGPDGATKLPLAILITLAFLRHRRRHGAGEDAEPSSQP